MNKLSALIKIFERLKLNKEAFELKKLAQETSADPEIQLEVEKQYKDELNLDGYQKMAKIIESGPHQGFYFTMSSVERVNYRPSSTYNTPLGVYSYPVQKDQFTQLINGDLPFRSDAKWIHFFHVDPSKILFLQDYDLSNLKSDLDRLNSIFRLFVQNKVKVPGMPPGLSHSQSAREDVAQIHFLMKGLEDVNYIGNFEPRGYELLKDSAYWLSKYKNDPAAILWAVTRNLSQENARHWASILFSLGYWGVHDNGKGIIHPNELTQAVFFNQFAPEIKEKSFLSVIDSQLNLNFSAPDSYSEEYKKNPSDYKKDRVLFEKLNKMKGRRYASVVAKALVESDSDKFNPLDLIMLDSVKFRNRAINNPSQFGGLEVKKLIRFLFVENPDQLKFVAKQYPNFYQQLVENANDVTIENLLQLQDFPKEYLFEAYQNAKAAGKTDLMRKFLYDEGFVRFHGKKEVKQDFKDLIIKEFSNLGQTNLEEVSVKQWNNLILTKFEDVSRFYYFYNNLDLDLAEIVQPILFEHLSIASSKLSPSLISEIIRKGTKDKAKLNSQFDLLDVTDQATFYMFFELLRNIRNADVTGDDEFNHDENIDQSKLIDLIATYFISDSRGYGLSSLTHLDDEAFGLILDKAWNLNPVMASYKMIELLVSGLNEEKFQILHDFVFSTHYDEFTNNLLSLRNSSKLGDKILDFVRSESDFVPKELWWLLVKIFVKSYNVDYDYFAWPWEAILNKIPGDIYLSLVTSPSVIRTMSEQLLTGETIHPKVLIQRMSEDRLIRFYQQLIKDVPAEKHFGVNFLLGRSLTHGQFLQMKPYWTTDPYQHQPMPIAAEPSSPKYETKPIQPNLEPLDEELVLEEDTNEPMSEHLDIMSNPIDIKED